MKQIAPLAFVMLIAAAAAMHQATAAASSDGAVKVTVNYQGKGTVDATHRVWVWLFDTPDIGPGSMPIAELSVDANGGTAAFAGVGAQRVYIAAAFDAAGTMSGNAPPPSGSPVGVLLDTEGRPRSVVPGEAAIVLTFDDSQRMP
jgi:hypothetical protein